MVTNVTPYCAVGPYDITSIVYRDGISPSGGARAVEEVTSPTRNYSDVRYKGRQPKKYKIRVRSSDRDEIETFLETLNTCDEDDEFYPFDADRFGLIASAHGYLESVEPRAPGYNFYTAMGEITCREAWLYGPSQGITFGTAVTVPAVSGAITNDGNEVAPVRYLQASGDYVSSSYVEDLSLRITPGTSTAEHDREIQLCEKMMRGDIFELGWRGEVMHSYESVLSSATESGYPSVVWDLQAHMGGSYVVGDGSLNLPTGAWFWVPFWGPLPISGEPDAAMLELWVTGVAGSPSIVYITDFTTETPTLLDCDLVVGHNQLYVPDMAGASDLGFGIHCDGASDDLTVSKFKATVKRYVAPQELPAADPLEEFKIRIECTAGTRLKFLGVEYNDRYYY